MKILQAKKSSDSSFVFTSEKRELREPLVLIFGNRYMLQDKQLFREVRELFPDGHLVFGSTSGEIMGEKVLSGTVVLTAVEFEKGHFLVKSENVSTFDHNECGLGTKHYQRIPKETIEAHFCGFRRKQCKWK